MKKFFGILKEKKNCLILRFFKIKDRNGFDTIEFLYYSNKEGKGLMRIGAVISVQIVNK